MSFENRLRIITISVFTSLGILSFQNCAPAQFDTVGGTMSSKSSTDVPVTVTGTGELDGAELEIPLDAHSPTGLEIPSHPGLPTGLEIPSLADLPAGLGIPTQPGSSGSPNAAASQCDILRGISQYFTLIPDTFQIVNDFGNWNVRGTHIQLIENSTGNVTFLGTAPGARIERISSSIGNFVVCDADVGVVDQKSFGNVLVFGGRIERVEDSAGNVVAIGGSIGTVERSFGNAVTEGGSIDRVKDSVGNAVAQGGNIGSVENSTGNAVSIGGRIGKVENSTGNAIATDPL